MAKDALGAHARDELGISEITTARPVQAALTSAASFSVGAAMPLLMVVVSPAGALVPLVSAASLGFLALLGAIGARAGGANILRATARVTFWGALAMALTAGIGKFLERLSDCRTEPLTTGPRLHSLLSNRSSFGHPCVCLSRCCSSQSRRISSCRLRPPRNKINDRAGVGRPTYAALVSSRSEKLHRSPRARPGVFFCCEPDFYDVRYRGQSGHCSGGALAWLR